MKNSFKFGFLALAISLSVAACNSNKSEEAATDNIDSVATMTTDSLEAQIDTVDSSAVDSIKK